MNPFRPRSGVRTAVTLALLALALSAAVALADTIMGDANAITASIDPSVTVAAGGSGSAKIGLVVNDNDGPGGELNGCNAGGGNPPVVIAVSSNQSWLSLGSSTVSVTACDSGTLADGLQNAATLGFSVAANAPAGATATVTAVYQSGGKPADDGETPGYTSGSFQVKTPAAVGDTTPPTVTSIDRDDSSPTNASSVDWLVTFSESVSGVDLTDFALAQTGVSGASITGISGSGTTRTVTASTGTGDGTLGLNLVDDDSIVDGASNKLGGTGTGNGSFTGQTYAIDKTKPVISASTGSYVPGTWTNQSVSVSFSCADGGPGTVTSSVGGGGTFSAQTGADGIDVTNTGSCTDAAGNTADSKTVTVKIDTTKPVIDATGKFADDSDYAFDTWTNRDVTVSFACSDGLSGIATDTVTGGGLFDDETPQAGTQVTNTGTCTDQAGNTALAKTVVVKIDKTDPTISATAKTADDAAYTSGAWTNQAVTVEFDCDDALSGLDGTCPDDVVKSDETTSAGEDVSDTVSDRAGNSATSNTINVRIDKTAPVVSVTGVTNGATYTLGSVPVPGCSTSDPLSDVHTNATVATSGGPVGSVTATCSGGRDNAGNTRAPVSATYSVVYSWTGFFSPVDNLPTLNSVKAGSAVPVKFSLGGNQGLGIMAAGFPKSEIITCGSTAPVDGIEETLTAGQSTLQYDAVANQYVYVWKTDKNWAGTCRQLVVKLADNTIQRANFKLLK